MQQQTAAIPFIDDEVAGDDASDADCLPAPLLSPVSDGEVFMSNSNSSPTDKANDDDDSFYGSDKEVDEAVEFSHTDSAASNSSASESEMESDKRAELVHQVRRVHMSLIFSHSFFNPYCHGVH